MHRFVLLVVLSALSLPAQQVRDADALVDPLIGTQRSAIGYGATQPFVTTPFGMTSWTAQTRQNKISVTSYNYDDTTISGFIGTHQPAVWMGDYGYVTLMPQLAGPLRVTPDARKLPFRHSDESAHPDLYTVSLDAGAGKTIRSEVTASARCGLLRFTFPRQDAGRVLIEASRPGFAGSATYNAATHEISGYNPHRMDAHLGPMALPHFKGYFVIQFQQAPRSAATYGMDDASASTARGAYADFAPGETVLVRVGTSFLSVEQARANLQHELPSWDFDAARQKLRAEWNEKLTRLQVTGATSAEQTRLYTAMYHALLYPRIFSEYGRYYSAYDDTIHTGESYTAFSLWDTFRAENSWLTLLAPERTAGMVTALLQNYKEGGWMPKWPNPSYTNIMIATHADSVVAEALRKGFPIDKQLAWQAVLKDAMGPPIDDLKHRWLDREEHTPYEARGGLTFYKQLGFIPTDKTDEAASRTLEDSYDDWCVAQVAKTVGREDDYRFFLKRSLNDRNLFNPALGLMNGKTSDGKWAPIGGPTDNNENRAVSGWTEGDAWVYTFSPFHDQAGLLQLLGGAEAYTSKLDQHFAGGHNVHKNEPSHHYPYLYDFSGHPEKTQAMARKIAATEYTTGPGGLDGDDDCGQMSAWLLFTALGFYPVNPASGDYMIGSPLYARMSLRLGNGKTFSVVADNNSAANMYIQSATLDGKALNVPVLTWEQIQSGGTLHFKMGPQPSRWASQWRPTPVDAH